MKAIVANPELVAYCGLYCGACGAYRKGRCPGCHDNAKATWCKVRTCCGERHHTSCAECAETTDPRACPKYNNLISKLVGFVLNSDRAACIDQIRAVGLQGHSERMATAGAQTIKKGAGKTGAGG
jgi:hypothetical protein